MATGNQLDHLPNHRRNLPNKRRILPSDATRSACGSSPGKNQLKQWKKPCPGPNPFHGAPCLVVWLPSSAADATGFANNKNNCNANEVNG
jgi:hypothetical protein